METAKPVKLTSHLIMRHLMRWAASNTQEIVVPNYYLGRWECDLLKISKAGLMYEYEVKVSRSDFFNDAKKLTYSGTATKHSRLKCGDRVDRFYFVVPKGMVQPSEVPAEFGLIYAYQVPSMVQDCILRFDIVKVAKLLRNKRSTNADFYKNLAANLSLKLTNAKSKR